MTQTLSASSFATVLPTSRITQSGAGSQSTISTASAASFDTARRLTARKEGNFVFKHGQRHHSYDSEKAPYPLSYDRAVLDLESLQHKFVLTLKGSVSFVNFEDDCRPRRVLDLGCGMGTWVIDAAKEWRNCEFVGFDLVNVQIPLAVLEASVARRIEWKHGNFLTTKLPFEDDEFDHVHVSMIAKGVPENKWGNLFEEINRVLTPGGTCEIVEDDVVFPILPKWFTQALRPKPKTSSIHLPNGLQGSSSSPDQSQRNSPPHDHALLESLYHSVFEHRFINTKPTAVLPSYFTTYFRQVTMGPVVHFPMPPLAPLQPLPPQIVTTYVLEPDTDTINPRKSTYYPTPVPMTRPMSLSFSSTTSSYTNKTGVDSIFSNRPRTASSATTAPDSPTSYIAPSGRFLKNVDSKKGSTSPRTPPTPPSPSSPSQFPRNRFMLDSSLSEKDIASLPRHLFPSEKLHQLSSRYLAMQLYLSCQCVLGCQEAMWEELKDRIRNRRHELSPYGWDDDDELEELQNRTRFEKLIERFESDMHLRISLWYSLTDLGWAFPDREPLTKAELVEEERIRANMLEARKQARPEEFDIPCRSVRVIVGFKL
ncbi:Demethylmenaquinone methyltransferase [Leucoagaricus sp. SymC.cos]|nr:Demethylmenaquinone methyltransferase [Leucoagaricus sp. SymC.cos]